MMTRAEIEAAEAELARAEWDAVKDKWPNNPNAPRPPDNNINLDEGLKAMRELRPTTDSIISKYENKLSNSTAFKALQLAQGGKPTPFTDEELAYLSKKVENDDSFISEVRVITPEPTIVLKKGKTEINVKGAAAVVKKMEEKYPTGVSKDTVDYLIRKPFVEASIEYGLKKEEESKPMADRFSKLVNFDSRKVSSETKKAVAPDLETFQKNKFEEPSRSVNKNAYEIRESILKMALEWATCNDKKLSPEEVIDVAKTFYSFVENKRY